VTVPTRGTFRWRGVDLTYETGPYNRATENERAVEVPIARRFILDCLDTHGAAAITAGLEVGNVLAHYTDAPSPWRVVDLYEEAPGVENLDVFDIEAPPGGYPWIVAISTLEHVETRGGPLAPIEALRHLAGLLAPGGRLLVTVPVGQHPYLDGACSVLTSIVGSYVVHEASLVHHEDRWSVHESQFQWGPLRENTWPSVVWVAEFQR
jgi:hypothetical protein